MLNLKSNRTPLALQHPLINHVNSLPYIDNYSNQIQNEVQNLIKLEMQNFTAPDYLGKNLT